MCWSVEASGIMVVAGAAASGLAWRQNQPVAIWATLGYFAAMEALQVGGYMVVDQCGSASNRAVTLLSYLHIVFQPLVINAFAMELVPAQVRHRVRPFVYGLCMISAAVMLAQLLDWPALGRCAAGLPLCAEAVCTVSGSWHIAWNIPYNGLLVPFENWLGTRTGFPTYMICAFGLPLFYGAWRFVLLHALAGPVLASALTDNPNEMPAIWCLFSVVVLLIALSPFVRRSVSTRSFWGLPV